MLDVSFHFSGSQTLKLSWLLLFNCLFKKKTIYSDIKSRDKQELKLADKRSGGRVVCWCKGRGCREGQMEEDDWLYEENGRPTKIVSPDCTLSYKS